MAKQTTFADKMKKKEGLDKVHVKIVRSSISKETGGVRFSEEIVGIPTDESIDKFVKDHLNKSN